MEKSLTDHARKHIKEIHALSACYNGKTEEHTGVLLELVKKHAKEIEQLHGSKDENFTVEVGDLLILCHELLLEHEKDPDQIMGVCYERYKKKLSELIEKAPETR